MKRVPVLVTVAAFVALTAGCGTEHHAAAGSASVTTAASGSSTTRATSARAATWQGGCPPESVVADGVGVPAQNIVSVGANPAEGATQCLYGDTVTTTTATNGEGQTLQFLYGPQTAVLTLLGAESPTTLQTACEGVSDRTNHSQLCAESEDGSTAYAVLTMNMSTPPPHVILDAILKSTK